MTEKKPGMDRVLVNAVNSFHALGARASYELIREISDQFPGADDFIVDRLGDYNRFDRTLIDTLTSSGQFPPPPIHRVK